MFTYNKRFIKLIRKELQLTQQEMSDILGIPRGCFVTYESGRSKGSRFFHERMKAVFGIDLLQPAELHKIVFEDPGKLKSITYQRLSRLEIYDIPEQEE